MRGLGATNFQIAFTFETDSWLLEFVADNIGMYRKKTLVDKAVPISVVSAKDGLCKRPSAVPVCRGLW